MKIEKIANVKRKEKEERLDLAVAKKNLSENLSTKGLRHE